MKLIVAIIQPDMLDKVSTALLRAQVGGLTVTDARGYGKDDLESDWDLSGFLTNKLRLEIALPDEQADDVVKLIQQTASTGQPGDGVIFVLNLENFVRINPDA